MNLFTKGFSQRSTFRVCHPFPCHPRNLEKAAKFGVDVITVEESLPFHLGDEQVDTQVAPEGLMDEAGRRAVELEDQTMNRFNEDTGLEESSPYQPPATRFC